MPLEEGPTPGSFGRSPLRFSCFLFTSDTTPTSVRVRSVTAAMCDGDSLSARYNRPSSSGHRINLINEPVPGRNGRDCRAHQNVSEFAFSVRSGTMKQIPPENRPRHITPSRPIVRAPDTHPPPSLSSRSGRVPRRVQTDSRRCCPQILPSASSIDRRPRTETPSRDPPQHADLGAAQRLGDRIETVADTQPRWSRRSVGPPAPRNRPEILIHADLGVREQKRHGCARRLVQRHAEEQARKEMSLRRMRLRVSAASTINPSWCTQSLDPRQGIRRMVHHNRCPVGAVAKGSTPLRGCVKGLHFSLDWRRRSDAQPPFPSPQIGPDIRGFRDHRKGAILGRRALPTPGNWARRGHTVDLASADGQRRFARLRKALRLGKPGAAAGRCSADALAQPPVGWRDDGGRWRPGGLTQERVLCVIRGCSSPRAGIRSARSGPTPGFLYETDEVHSAVASATFHSPSTYSRIGDASS